MCAKRFSTGHTVSKWVGQDSVDSGLLAFGSHVVLTQLCAREPGVVGFTGWPLQEQAPHPQQNTPASLPLSSCASHLTPPCHLPPSQL